MPWVRLDDRFPSHRKVALLSDRAFRLYVSALCWASENLTEGKILDRELTLVARVRGMKAAATELEGAQLWDRLDDGWQIHDYLEYNPDRAKVKAERESNAARQQAWRDRKKAERDAKEAAAKAKEEAERNAVTTHVTNGVSNGAPSPAPAPSTSFGSTAAGAAAEAAGLPDPFDDLKKALAAAGLGAVAWDIKRHSDWQRIKTQLDRLGVDLMVKSAANSARAQGEPASVTAWIGRWQSLPDPKPNPATRDSPSSKPPHCGHPDCDPVTRTRETENDRGIRSLDRCPDCHPNAKGRAA